MQVSSFAGLRSREDAKLYVTRALDGFASLVIEHVLELGLASSGCWLLGLHSRFSIYSAHQNAFARLHLGLH